MSIRIKSISKGNIEYFKKALKNLSRLTPFPEKAFIQFDKRIDNYSFLQKREEEVNLLAINDRNEIIGVLNGTGIEGGVGTIIWLLVSKKEKNKGLGSMMFKKACNLYIELGAHKVKLTVPEKGTTKFYEKQGMKLEGFHPNHWWGMDIWSMGIILKN